MPIDSTNLLLSLAILQRQRVARDKTVAASIGAALIPGPVGLALPLIAARSQPVGSTSSSAGQLSLVPDVVDKEQAEAEAAIKGAGLNPVSQSFFTPAGFREGTVVKQDPEPGLVPTGSDVNLSISLG